MPGPEVAARRLSVSIQRGRTLAAGAAAVAVAAAAGVGLSQPASGTVARDRCAEERSRTIKANRFERVFYAGTLVSICDRGTGARATLGEEDLTFLKHTLVLKGHVAFAVAISGGIAEEGIPRTSENASAILMRIVMPRDRRRSYMVPSRTISNYENPIDQRAVYVARLVMATNQTIVLTTCTLALEPRLGCAANARVKVVSVPVHAYFTYTKRRTIQPTANPVVLAEGPGIDPKSLRLSPSGRTAAWTQDGKRRTAAVSPGSSPEPRSHLGRR